MEFLGRVAHGRVEPGQGSVHRLAVGQVADARMLVVTGGGQHRGAQRIPVAGQRRAGVGVDGVGDRCGEGRIGVGAEHGTHGGILNHQVELGDGRLHESGHRRPPRTRPFLMALGHRFEHAREAAQPGQVSLASLFGVERDLGQRAQHLADRRGERVADGELDDRHGRRVGHAAGQAAHEVERLHIRLGEAGVGCLLRPGGDGCQLARVPRLGLPAEVGQERVVAGKAVERPGHGIRHREHGRQQLGSKFVSEHRGRLPRATAPARPVIRGGVLGRRRAPTARRAPDGQIVAVSLQQVFVTAPRPRAVPPRRSPVQPMTSPRADRMALRRSSTSSVLWSSVKT